MELNEFIQRFKNVKKSGKGYIALCPAHDDKKQSLSINKGNKDNIVINCHAGCSYLKVLKSVNLQPSDLYCNNSQNNVPSIETEYVYKDANNMPLYKVIRYNPKNFKQAKYESNKWIYNMNNVTYVPYNLQEVLNNNVIFWGEGEKDVENLKQVSLVGTTTCSGANGFNKADKVYISYFKNKTIYIIPDNDEAGMKYAMNVLNKLRGIAKEVNILQLQDIVKDLKKGGDISDILERFGKEKTMEIIKKLIEDCNKNALMFKIQNRLQDLKPEINYSRDEQGYSQLFYEIFKHTIKYDSTLKEWRYFDGIKWTIDYEGLKVSNLIKTFKSALELYSINVIDEGYLKSVKKFGSKAFRDIIIKDARDIDYIKEGMLDKDLYLLNCKNGTLDLNDFSLGEHKAEDLISKITNVTYNPNLSSEIFLKFIYEIFEGNEEKIKFVQKALGYSLTGSTIEEKFFIFYGKTTRNGKGTLVSTISHLLGSYSISSQPEILSIKKFKDSRQASGDIARLKEARFLSISEPPEKMVLDVALLKTLSGRDSITARQLYQSEIEYYPKFKMFMDTNYLPIVNDLTLFDSNRLLLITFNRHFKEDEQDKTLKDKLRKDDELSGILNWLLEGLKLYNDEGLNPPDCVKEDTLEYYKECNNVETFIDEELSNTCREMTKKYVYSLYDAWTLENDKLNQGHEKLLNTLRNRGYIKATGKINNQTYKEVICCRK